MWGRMWGKMMAKHPSNKLTALAVKKHTTPDRYSDGNGLYLIVDPSGAKRWLQRLSVQGKCCDLGLGSVRLISLDNAREQALINRRVARAGGDPAAKRRHEKGLSMPFKDATLEVYKANLPVWGNKKHATQWFATMENHVFPKIGAKPVGSIQFKIQSSRTWQTFRKLPQMPAGVPTDPPRFYSESGWVSWPDFLGKE